MAQDDVPDPTRLPGLFRVWDLQSVLTAGADYDIRYADTAGDGTPLFAVFRHSLVHRPLSPEVLQ